MIEPYQQWALLIVVVILTALVIALPIITYSLTGNWLTLTSAVGTIPIGYIWTWITRRIYPLNQRDHERELAKISNKRKESAHKDTSSHRNIAKSISSTIKPIQLTDKRQLRQDPHPHQASPPDRHR